MLFMSWLFWVDPRDFFSGRPFFVPPAFHPFNLHTLNRHRRRTVLYWTIRRDDVRARSPTSGATVTQKLLCAMTRRNNYATSAISQ
jgi:hypothetical protein